MQPVVTTWTTKELARHDRYDAWACMLSETYGRWEVSKPNTPDFSATVKCYDDSILKIIECMCDPCAAKRSRASVTADDCRALTVQMVLEGREYIDFNGEEMALGPGDLLIWDSTKPMTFCVQERLHKISVVMPLQRFQCWLPRSWFSIRHSIDGHSDSGILLANHVESLSKSVFHGGCKDDYALIDATIGLLVNALDIGSSDDPQPLRVTQLHHMKQYILANLRNPDLSPAMIAKAGHMSVRYLQWLFHSSNETVKQYILSQRLDVCIRDLTDPHMKHRKLSDIAFYWGFKDATHFSKRFKQRYGMSPRSYREMCAARSAGTESHQTVATQGH
jgi:AraC-like DNA-binding protein